MSERRIAAFAMAMLMLCGAFGTDLDIWVGTFMVLCLGLTFGLWGDRGDADER